MDRQPNDHTDDDRSMTPGDLPEDDLAHEDLGPPMAIPARYEATAGRGNERLWLQTLVASASIVAPVLVLGWLAADLLEPELRPGVPGAEADAGPAGLSTETWLLLAAALAVAVLAVASGLAFRRRRSRVRG